ncbi:hypothetical protein SKAU_G00273010 [Synaphobranchus kaupii]|uniref:Uncharacterized protein n=1 Tax=Synaphobranchus kaupii TaxID=118154 RepID=A0A9Q1F0M4_SYNKA|nr:hypothetical protein SKAU_G00273010 [Synaphobranchus kaupii]
MPDIADVPRFNLVNPAPVYTCDSAACSSSTGSFWTLRTRQSDAAKPRRSPARRRGTTGQTQEEGTRGVRREEGRGEGKAEKGNRDHPVSPRSAHPESQRGE